MIERCMTGVRNDWTKREVTDIYWMPLMELVYQAQVKHRLYHDPERIQQCTLLSIKTGGCPEDCSYCPQSARYDTTIENEPLLTVEEVLKAARQARQAGSTRFCMGAAWRSPKEGENFERVLEMVEGVSALGMEVCCTLGMITLDQAKRLKEAGLTAYNHNLDSGENFYKDVISTRTYLDRLETLENVRRAEISVCCGGIVGMGESHEDRIDLLHTLATLDEHPESVPVNSLVPVEGTPLAEQKEVPFQDILRMIATARIIMPVSRVRLSAGRIKLSDAEQMLCFMAGANSIFTGEKLLTTPNNDHDSDRKMLDTLGLKTESLVSETLR